MKRTMTSVWLEDGARVVGSDYPTTCSMWLGDDLTIFGPPEVLGAIGEKIAEEAYRIIEARDASRRQSVEEAVTILLASGAVRDVAD